jgi:signal transduction histidine kinase
MLPGRIVIAGHASSGGRAVVVLLLSGLLAVALGAWFVGRPVALIRRSARALGGGRARPPIALDRRDELAIELDTVSERIVARERLQHADRLQTIGQLASGVAHELGTPLSIIGVRARLIASGEATEREAQASAAAILEQSARMTAIVGQLLDYARRQRTPMGLFDLRQLVSGSLAMLEPLAQKQAVRIDLVLPEQPILIRGDKTRLQQVVTNLAMNGIQAMTAGGWLRVEVRPAPAPHRSALEGWLSIRVTDEGPGIAADHLPHIFEPFFTTKPVGEGTGLGLAVVQAIVHEHGGWVTASNEPAAGACFTVFLAPVREEAAPERIAS